jgi:hypothetical protein
MLLLDHIETVQDCILSWVEQMEKEVDDLSEGCDETEDAMAGVQSTLDQLSDFRCQLMEKVQ